MRVPFPALGSLLVVALLAACAPEPVRTAVPLRASDVAAGPGAARLAAAAEREWRDWGSIAVEGWPIALERTPDATPDLFDRLMTYWGATRDGPGIVAAHRRFRDEIGAAPVETASLDPAADIGFRQMPVNVGISSYNTPAWSAAFVSHVVERAGIGEFRPSSAHAMYLDPLLARAAADPEGAPFRPHAPAEYAPRPGDLVCFDRSASPLLHWTERLAEPGRSRPMHCDVVTAVRGGSLDLIGGNVLDVVLRRRVATDAAGRLETPPLDRPPFLLVMENRR